MITGASGYLGGHLCSLLALQTDWRMLGMVRNASAGVFLGTDVAPFVFDLMTGEDAELLAAMRKVDAVVHLASGDAAECAADPLLAVRMNVGGTVRVCEAARKCNVRRVVYLSTIHVYGSSLSGVVTEDTTTRPMHPYAISHRAAEDFVLAGFRSFSPVVIRMSNACGFPLSDRKGAWKLLINDLCRQAVTDCRLTLQTSGFLRRDFVPVTDAVRGILHLLELGDDAIGNGVFNLGGDNVLSVRGAAELVANRCYEVMGFRPGIVSPEGNDSALTGLIRYPSVALERTGFRRESTLSITIDDCLSRAAAKFSTLRGAKVPG